MLDHPTQLIDRITTKPRFLLMLMITLTLVGTVNLAKLPWTLPTFKATTHGSTILDMRFHYSAEEAYQAIAGYGDAGRALYMHILWPLDVLIPFCASMMFAMAITLAWRTQAQQRSGLRYLGLIGLCAGLTDYAENIAITALLSSYPAHLDSVGTLAGYLTSAKHILYVTSLLTALTGGVMSILRKPSPQQSF